MSYLDLPRFHFVGRFQADPPTINNEISHYDNERFVARFQMVGDALGVNGYWNPAGSAAFRLSDCRVTACTPDGGRAAEDTLLGGSIEDAYATAPAKLVDLDPQQQGASEIWGLSLRCLLGDGTPAFTGQVRHAACVGLWQRARTGFGSSVMGGAYQSVIEHLEWIDQRSSRVLDQLRERAEESGALSVKLNVDGFERDPASGTFTWGRLSGSIGPWREDEPRHWCGRSRLLIKRGGRVANVPFVVRDERITFDFGNSLPTQTPRGPAPDLGPLRVSVSAAGERHDLCRIDVSSADVVDRFAGVVDARIPAESADLVAHEPVQVLDRNGDAYLQEREDGAYVCADGTVVRLYPEGKQATARINVHLAYFGSPADGVKVRFALDEAAMSSAAPPGPALGTPPTALELPDSLTTDEHGRVPLKLTAHDPGTPRGYLDGQLYFVRYGNPDDDGDMANGHALSVLVWSLYEGAEHPTWLDDVQPILQRYANLYPVMASFVDLSSYHSVVERRAVLRRTLTQPVEHANHMPVSRDLSPGKRRTILDWLGEERPRIYREDDIGSVRRLVQSAIELEHATIPLYLVALFSLKPGHNADVAAALRRVVQQEMLHMALACNLKNALGEGPAIAQPGFMPRYPGHLPGSVMPDLVVSLRRCSRLQIRDVFMEIERPAHPLEETDAVERLAAQLASLGLGDDGTLADGAAGAREAAPGRFSGVEHEEYTIGWLYNQIARSVMRLGEDAFTGDPDRQLTPRHWPRAPGRLYKITDVATALLAINEIVAEGEGAPLTDDAASAEGLSHYYAFAEIVEGRRFVQAPDGTWSYSGTPIVFDEDQVLPMVDDPVLATVADGPAREGTRLFDEMYAGLLRRLHEVFNGHPGEVADAIGAMFALEVQGRKLLATPCAQGSAETAGPTFMVAPSAGGRGDDERDHVR